VAIQDVTPELAKSFGLSESRGALVGEVIDGSPAAKSGIRSGDVITGVNGKKVESPAILRNTIAQIPPGKTVKVELVRDRKTQSVEATIGEQPKDLHRAGAEPSADDKQETTLRGLELQDLTQDISSQLDLPAGLRGVVVSNVDVDSPAGAAGLQRGDVITEINKTAVRSVKEFERAASKAGAKDNVLLRIVRQGSYRYVVLKP